MVSVIHREQAVNGLHVAPSSDLLRAVQAGACLEVSFLAPW